MPQKQEVPVDPFEAWINTAGGLAKASKKLKISATQLSRIRGGRRQPTMEQIIRIKRVIELDANYWAARFEARK